ncbi:unnamed protein product [Candidula unifasciata]|uniref:Nanos-type domain-containing protein n=1 Tax=Candidula unifasciata TaxID=100452 RepID=A0A8S3ZW12_9EUPU|nr:unnamed protein product [Candidula unifasciata]
MQEVGIDEDTAAEEFNYNGVTKDLDRMDILAIESRRRNWLRSQGLEVSDEAFQETLEATREEIIRTCPVRPKKHQVCVFCKNNKEREEVYTSHMLKDSLDRVICPILSKYTCPVCYATGANAHTKKYCPKYDGISTVNLLLQTPRNCSGKYRK